MANEKSNSAINILLVEDDLDDRFSFEKALNLVPVETKLNMVNDGEHLMEYLIENSKNLPDIIFLDISMPRKTGIECLVEIQKNKLTKIIPISMLSTSYVKDFDYEKCIKNMLLRMGAKEFIRKPSNIEGFIEVIETSLKMISK
jgi:CheY-like chemotaxis protein